MTKEQALAYCNNDKCLPRIRRERQRLDGLIATRDAGDPRMRDWIERARVKACEEADLQSRQEFFIWAMTEFGYHTDPRENNHSHEQRNILRRTRQRLINTYYSLVADAIDSH